MDGWMDEDGDGGGYYPGVIRAIIGHGFRTAGMDSGFFRGGCDGVLLSGGEWVGLCSNNGMEDPSDL